ncbi:MAG: transcription antitermination factor NusB [Chitinivibrionales bacterium]|nr:transcription antitermination factor NusB [Chitinivibrionales bacterium]MBD3396994.1 transcription antitermination factor NusB [Chitinivibrionales bacterium]
MATTKRRKARELALQTLYALEMRGLEDASAIFDSIAEARPVADDVRAYARELAAKAVATRDDADALIRRHAANWELKRLAAIDRNLLRMAITELRHFPDTPPKVVIDEAVEIAKIFSTEESSRFVNGVIDSIYKELGTIQV